MPNDNQPNPPHEQTNLISTQGQVSQESNLKHIRIAAMLWTAGCLYGASSVVLGAFGAHGLKKRISDPARLANWDTAAKYQAIHSLAILVGSIGAPKNKLAGGLFAAGIILFSGSIYLLVLDPQRFKVVGPVTPIGGLCLIGGWLALAFGSRGRIVL